MQRNEIIPNKLSDLKYVNNNDQAKRHVPKKEKKKKKKDKYLDHSKAQGRWIGWDLCVPSSSFPLPPPFGSTELPSLPLTFEPIPTASVSQQKRVMAIPATDLSQGLGCLRRDSVRGGREEKSTKQGTLPPRGSLGELALTPMTRPWALSP